MQTPQPQPAPAAERTPVPRGLRPINPADFAYAHARHLLLRAGFGGTPEQIRTVARWGPERAADHLVNFTAAPEHEAQTHTRFDPDIIIPLTAAERRIYAEARRRQDEDTLARFRQRRQRQQAADRRQIVELQRWWLARMIETPRPLEEKLTLFWHSHFATSYRTIENSYHLLKQNRLFREHAAGNFGALLYNIIRDPAMIAYLDNDQNRRGSPNENLARELMELFSLGEGGYSERDIREGARALTGYTYERNTFIFRNELHDTGPKRILGRAGNLDGDDFVSAILERKRCSEFIAMKLYAFFVEPLPATSDPDYRAMTAAIEDMASTIRNHNYDLAPALIQLFTSDHFYHTRFRAQRIKSPAELVVGAIRSLRTPARSLDTLNDAMGLMGQRLFFPPSVAGWPGGRAWINTSTIFTRQNILNFLITGKTPEGFDPLADTETWNPTHLLQDLTSLEQTPGPDDAIPYLTRFMLGRTPSQPEKHALTSFINNAGGTVNTTVLTGLVLLLSAAPEYQLC